MWFSERIIESEVRLDQYYVSLLSQAAGFSTVVTKLKVASGTASEVLNLGAADLSHQGSLMYSHLMKCINRNSSGNKLVNLLPDVSELQPLFSFSEPHLPENRDRVKSVRKKVLEALKKAGGLLGGRDAHCGRLRLEAVAVNMVLGMEGIVGLLWDLVQLVRDLEDSMVVVPTSDLLDFTFAQVAAPLVGILRICDSAMDRNYHHPGHDYALRVFSDHLASVATLCPRNSLLQEECKENMKWRDVFVPPFLAFDIECDALRSPGEGAVDVGVAVLKASVLLRVACECLSVCLAIMQRVFVCLFCHNAALFIDCPWRQSMSLALSCRTHCRACIVVRQSSVH